MLVRSCGLMQAQGCGLPFPRSCLCPRRGSLLVPGGWLAFVGAPPPRSVPRRGLGCTFALLPCQPAFTLAPSLVGALGWVLACWLCRLAAPAPALSPTRPRGFAARSGGGSPAFGARGRRLAAVTRRRPVLPLAPRPLVSSFPPCPFYLFFGGHQVQSLCSC